VYQVFADIRYIYNKQLNEHTSSKQVSRRPLTSSDDGQWSEGLISASRLVAAATHSLVESANALVQGISSEEKLISSAKQVASSTAQLLVSCKVKADPDSASTKRLLVNKIDINFLICFTSIFLMFDRE